MLSLKTKELSSARDMIQSVCREIRFSFSLVFYQFEWHSGVESGDANVVCENQLSYR